MYVFICLGLYVYYTYICIYKYIYVYHNIEYMRINNI